VLFLHWDVADRRLRELVPGALELDRWQGSVWVSAIAFRLAKVQLRGLPPIPLCTDFLELNLRTYVRYRGQLGIYFLSMHADSRVAVAAARWLTPLPYRFAPMTCRNERKGWHLRCGGNSANWPVLLDGHFEEWGAAACANENSLDAWLVERYAAFVPDRRGRLHRMVCEHAPWVVSSVICDITRVGCEPAIGLLLGTTPSLCHLSTGVESLIGPFEPL